MQIIGGELLVLAYFDPGSGSLVLQTIVGGTAGLCVFGNYLWAFVKHRLRILKSANSSVSDRPGTRTCDASHAA